MSIDTRRIARPPENAVEWTARPRRRIMPTLAWLAAVVAVLLGVVLRIGAAQRTAFDNARLVLRWEALVGLDVERGLQAVVSDRPAVRLSLSVVYAVAYWPFLVAALVVTARADPPAFRLLRNALSISGAIGLFTMVVFPVAPPRLLDGYDDHMAGLGVLGAAAHPDGWFNPHAAMPSFHVCWTIVAAVSLCHSGRRTLRGAVPIVMSVAVITTGNHFVLDVVGGALLAAAAWRLAPTMQHAFDTARAQRVASRATPPTTPSASASADDGSSC